MKNFSLLLCCLMLLGVYNCQTVTKYYKFVLDIYQETSMEDLITNLSSQIMEVPYKRLCSTKKILTVNGQFPGPTLYAHRGDTLIVDVINQGNSNITIHWHGVKMPKNPWYDGPAYITQCPIQPGKRFKQKVILSDEEGTVWWHAHSEFDKATVHGPIIIYPKPGKTYPFRRPDKEVPIVLGEWWKVGIQELYQTFTETKDDPDQSDALTINGQPGDLFPCSKAGTFKMIVHYGRTYLLRIIHAGMSELNFFAVANHSLTVVGSDGSYVKPFTSDYITISPGQTIDVLLTANQTSNHYYMAAKVYNGGFNPVDNTTTTAILKYAGNYTASPTPIFPTLPGYTNVTASANFTFSMRSLADYDHPIDVPMKIDYRSLYVLTMNLLPCKNHSCIGFNGSLFASSINNMSFVEPKHNILEMYYHHRGNGLFGTRFPAFPREQFNYTSTSLPAYLLKTKRTTQLRLLKYNSTVEIILQGTSLLGGTEHPMHLHGASFYVVGWGLGNFNNETDPAKYNLVDPPLVNTVSVPVKGWTTIRFRADNPGVWLMHCHFDRHMFWGMETVFIVTNGKAPNTKIKPPPLDMPLC